MIMTADAPSRYIVLLSIHGLFRGHDLELGRDADTGGQILYVIELARALAKRPDVDQVDLFTRLVDDPNISPDYAVPIEPIGDGARIVRIEAGPPEYLPKEQLWDHLDTFADNALSFLRESDRLPCLIHSHYADAGYVGVRLSAQLGVPLVHTGHSLGRVKRRRLLASGVKQDVIDTRYNMTRRINAEEETLGAASLVITSTTQEIEEQYGLYDHYQPERMQVIPPGTDLERFRPPDGREQKAPIRNELLRFLREPKKPLILALSRPDERKNIATLVEAYGESPELQRTANLVIVAGNRDDLRDMDSGAQTVLTDILLLIDLHDLYGRVAYPKHHSADEVALLYQIAAASRGVFINPALTEPFGLTLIEAAASGLPIVATEDGGPIDIIDHCRNGILIDPLDKQDITKALLKVLCDASGWRKLAQNGLAGVREHYAWSAHADSYMEALDPLLEKVQPPPQAPLSRRRILYHDRAIFTDLDQNLLGDPDSLADFIRILRDNRKCSTFGIATGRRLDSALAIMRRYGIPRPDVLITALGTEIYYAPQLTADGSWTRHIDNLWYPRRVRDLLVELPGVKPQQKSEQSRFKVSFFYDPEHAPSLDDIGSLLHQADLNVHLNLSFGQFLDVVPARASKGLALRYVADQWGIPLEHCLCAGGSGADEDMMRGNTLAVVVANRHNEELSKLIDTESIYFAQEPFAAGILEAIDHYDFFAACQVPPAPDAEPASLTELSQSDESGAASQTPADGDDQSSGHEDEEESARPS
ncbi:MULTISPECIES: HAD-IIB family hydrolase [Thiorhodovibrio]|uniref:HAD-IIB family hydrolase n=1 Tax=Thiorhodovibrio TaxID=61593 RepID=UPI001F5CBF8F|nr:MULTISPECIES: HAD-IIB family hydrolase [Thiorhodovibrio]MBK5969598.1 HAD family hydrolase [Thiorhodovibrio winogradskyi]WPL14666.1 Mannosylfructose-phosphate synthase [Thiorhodovibrio litoralis]